VALLNADGEVVGINKPGCAQAREPGFGFRNPDQAARACPSIATQLLGDRIGQPPMNGVP